MKHTLITLYLVIFTGGTYAQTRPNTVVAEVDFNRPNTMVIKPSYLNLKQDTIRATLLITSGHMTMAHEKSGYVVFRTKDTIYLDDRLRQLKAPVKVWGFKKSDP
jgi:hypothetical protein